MRGGQNRLPTEVKEAKGTSQPCRQNAQEPRLKAIGLPDAPEGMKDAERVLWVKLARQVEAIGVYTAADETAFELLVDAVQYAIDLKTDTEASPNQKVAARNAALGALASFGLTPQARGRVSRAPTDEAEDELAEFVN